MPIYEFVCRECGSEFEQLMSFSAHGHPPCPACASQHVSRKIGRPAIHFKGSGWYVTDSKGSKQSANGGGDKESSAEGENKSAEKSAEKGADKSSSKAEGKSGEISTAGEGATKGATKGDSVKSSTGESKAEAKAGPAPAA